jgi:hypothetical protein
MEDDKKKLLRAKYRDRNRFEMKLPLLTQATLNAL